MDFARETRSQTVRAACGRTSSEGKEWTTRSSVPELLEASVRGHSAMRRCTLGGWPRMFAFLKHWRDRRGQALADADALMAKYWS